ncbi:SAV_2336 N-terminal domain-related protein [Streptomyces barringtoniae]|uniref:SAV_2336 N-terminal domain-related protein n=1 Tax=Streptomyces barringtoniae TaxID=2892029 RepID=UPI001E457F78|nr:SAV_2336 N-terminal domain-related protein [Streptomyces barringtoniae]MCC5476064.1 protein kinase [Streptomyces barringtoniae]
MPSDHPAAAAPAPYARLADVLAKATDGARPTPLELAELLWLARQLGPADGTGEHSGPPAPTGDPGAPPQQPGQEPAGPAPAPDRAEGVESPGRASPRAPLHLPSPTSAAGPYTALHAPAPPMLRHPLGLQRALRPLKRHTDAPVGHRLDEQATADRIARLGAEPQWWLPVLRPARERWLRLHLVYDAGPTMPVWRPLIRELHQALAQSGVFRTVSVHRADPDGTVGGDGPYGPGDGRTVTLLISDCMGPQWWQGEAGGRWYGSLRRWAHRMPLAVVQPLPEHLWRGTALPAAPGVFSAPFPAAPTAALGFTPYEEWQTKTQQGTVALPVLEAGPRWLAHWAGLVASMGGSAFPGSAALLGPPPGQEESAERTDLAGLTAEELVLRFRATASPEAFRLAGHLALGRPDLPVMRLVQRVIEPVPRPQHLAEVILSGVLTTVPGPPGSYAFRPGVRALLLRGLPRSARSATVELLARVGGLIEERAGAAPGEFRAVTPAADGAGAAADGEAFATVRPESVRRLTGGGSEPEAPPDRVGRYELLRRFTPSGRAVWLARDPESDRQVAVRLYRPFPDGARREAFLRDAERLRALADRNLAHVSDFGIENGRPYLVMAYVPGVNLNALARPGGYHIPAPLLVSVGAQVAQAIAAVHEAGLTHGDLGLSRVMLTPDGRVQLSGFAPGRTSGAEGRAQDLAKLGRLMQRLASGSARAAPPFPPDRLRHLPQSLREPYARALGLLISGPPQDQLRGRDLLMDGELLRLAQEGYDQQRSYRILGPVTVRVGGRTVDLAPEEAAVLAMLVLRAGREVTHADLRAGLWARHEEPEDAAAALDGIASRLRARLGPGVLAVLPTGYALHTSADFVDLARHEHFERTATERTRAGHHQEAVALLDMALVLWRGQGPLAGVPGPAARKARSRLLELRLVLHRKIAELHLDLGEYHRAGAQLTDLVRQYPSREDFRLLLLITLRRLGRTEEALEVYEDYELSGGRNPELLALGHELRGEYDDPSDDTGAALDGHDTTPLSQNPVPEPDGLPEGSFPTEESLPSIFEMQERESAVEAPLPQNVVPESLFAVDDPLAEEPDGPYDERPDEDEDGYDDLYDALGGGPPPPTYRTVATYEFADGAQHPDTVAALGRAVTRLLTASGWTGYFLGPTARDNGWTVVTERDVPGLPLLHATMRHFEDEVVGLGGLRWLVTFECLVSEGHVERPDTVAVRRTLDAAEDRRGIVAVPRTLRDELDDDSGLAPWLQSLRPGTDAGWYRLCRLARLLFDGTHALPPVTGPHPLPPGAVFPEGTGETRTVVYRTDAGELSRTRRPGATQYFEVDLTGRRLELDETQSSFRATGTAIWHVSDPLQAVRTDAPSFPELIREAVRGRLRHLASTHPDATAGSRVSLPPVRPEDVPGCTVRCELRITRTRA